MYKIRLPLAVYVGKWCAYVMIAYRKVAAMLTYLHSWQTKRYFIICNHENQIDIILCDCQCPDHIKETCQTVHNISDIEPSLIEMARHHADDDKTLRQAESVPIFVVVQSADCAIKTFALNTIPIWRRHSAIKRIQSTLTTPDSNESMVPPNTWVQRTWLRHYKGDVRRWHITSRHAWLGVLQLDESTQPLYDWLHNQKRPVIAARWAPLMLAEHLWLNARTIVQKTNAPWVIMLSPFGGEGFHLFVYHHECMVLYRQGFLNRLQEDCLMDEVHKTLRYIERIGYCSTIPFCIVSFEFKGPKNSLCLPHGEWIEHTLPHNHASWLQKAVQRWCLRQHDASSALWRTELSPAHFISAWMAYRLSRFLRMLGTPALHLLCWSTIILLIKTSCLHDAMHIINTDTPLHENEKVLWEHMHYDQSQLKLYCTLYPKRPVDLVQRLTPLLTPIGVIQNLHYDLKDGTHPSLCCTFLSELSNEQLVYLQKALTQHQYKVEHKKVGTQNVLNIDCS